MLENSDLTKRKIIVSDKDAMKCLEGTRKDKKAIAQMKQRLQWVQKEESEILKIRELFSEKIANFIIESSQVRFSFEQNTKADQALNQSNIQITTAHIRQIAQGEDYTIQTYYSTHRISNDISGKNTDTSVTRQQKLEMLLPRKTTGKKMIKTKESKQVEPNRLLVIFNDNFTKESPAIKQFEKFIGKKYKHEIAKHKSFEENTEGYYGSSTSARINSMSARQVISRLSIRKPWR